MTTTLHTIPTSGTNLQSMQHGGVHILGSALAGSTLVTYVEGPYTQIGIKYTADGATWTNFTFTPTGFNPSQSSQAYFASTIDESNNLHIVWLDNAALPASSPVYVRYVKFTVSGTTWTQGTTEVISGPLSTAPADQVETLAIECLGGGVVVAGWHVRLSGGGPTFPDRMDFAIRRTGGAWSSVFTEPGNTSTTGYIAGQSFPTPPSIARGAPAVGSTQTVAFIIGSLVSASLKIVTKVLDVTAGTVSSTTVISSSFGSTHTYRHMLFTMPELGANHFVALAADYDSSATMRTDYCANFNDTTLVNVASSLASVPGTGTFPGQGVAATATTGHAGFIALTASGSGVNVTAHVATVGSSGVSWAPEYNFVTPGALTVSTAPLVQGSANRNLSLKHAAIIFNDGATHPALTLVETSGASSVTVTSQDAPANGSTVATNHPTFNVHLAVAFDPQGARIDVGTTAAFTVPVLTIDPPGSAYQIPTTRTRLSASSAGNTVINQVTNPWYWRATAIDVWGQLGTPSGVFSFTDSHPPVITLIHPGSGALDVYPVGGNYLFTWVIGPEDDQIKYQVVVERNSDGLLVADTGLVTSTSPQATVNVPLAYKGVTLRWKARIVDIDNITGPYTPYTIFTLDDPPVVAITSPTSSSTVNNPSPRVFWTDTISGGRTQQSYDVVWARQDTGLNVFDSGFTAGADLNYQPPMPILENAQVYLVTVFVRDSGGLRGSAQASSITTAWTPPAAPTWSLIPSTYVAKGYVKVTWTDAGKDSMFLAWRLYRAPHGTTNWTKLVDTNATASAFEYDDYFALPGTNYDYVVVQVATRFGAVVESVYAPIPTGVLVSTDYWLLHPTDLTQHMLLPIVTAETYVREEENADLNLIGRGRKKDYGTIWGFKGTLTAELRDFYDTVTATTITARQLQIQVLSFKANHTTAYLRNPFGDLLLVALDDISVTRVSGVGGNEYVDLTIPYVEVAP